MTVDRRNLPPEVLARLAANDVDLAAHHGEAVQRGRTLEARGFTRPEIRLSDSGDPIFEGYATVYDVAYPIAGGPEAGGWMEIVERGATAKSIKDGADVRLLYDHGGIALARTSSGTMRLISDDMGMMVNADLDPESPYAQSVRSAVLRGDVDQMSFAFRVTRQSWNEDYTERRIKEVQLFDASLVTYPASEATVAQLNNAHPKAEERELDAAAEAVEDDLVAQIRVLLARLIAGEAAELEAGCPAAQSIQALVDVLCALDCMEQIDEAEDAGMSVMMSESDDMMYSLSLVDAQAELAVVRTNAA
jgi:HK97 family phage prohead protease